MQYWLTKLALKLIETCSTYDAYTANNANTNNYMKYWHYDGHIANFLFLIDTYIKDK